MQTTGSPRARETLMHDLQRQSRPPWQPQRRARAAASGDRCSDRPSKSVQPLHEPAARLRGGSGARRLSLAGPWTARGHNAAGGCGRPRQPNRAHAARVRGAGAARLAALRSTTAGGRMLRLLSARWARTRRGGRAGLGRSSANAGQSAAGRCSAVVSGAASARYEQGLLALREGPLLEAALRALPELPHVVMTNASGRDHPRTAGLAVHLGAALELPSVGATDRPLLATGPEPGPNAARRAR